MKAPDLNPSGGFKKRGFGDLTVGLSFGAAVAAAIFFYYHLTRQIPTWDAVFSFSPYFSLLADFARAGQFMLWNPYVNCGAPDLAYPEMGAFSPITLALALITGGGHTGFLLYWVLIWGLFGAGAGLLAFHLGAPRPVGMAVAAGMMFSGFFFGHATHTSWLYAFAFLPLVLWRLDVSLLSGRLWPAVEAGALYGLSALAGHPALVILNGLFLGAWALGRILFGGAQETSADAGPALRAKRSIIALALLLAVGLVVMSPSYLAFVYEVAGYSERTGYLAREIAIDDQAMPPAAIATLASSYLAALKLSNPDLLPEVFVQLANCYAGAVILALALAALTLVPRDRFRWWVLAAGLFFLLAAMGSATPIRGWLYDLCPPTRFFRHSGVMRAYFLFSLGVLAMLGGREWDGPNARRAWKHLLYAALVIAPIMTAAFALFVSRVDDRGPGLIPAVTQLILAWGGLALIAHVGRRDEHRPRTYPWLLLALALVDGGFGLYLSKPMMVTDRFRFEKYERTRRHDINPPHGFKRARQEDYSFPTDLNFYSKTALVDGCNQLSHRFYSRTSLFAMQANWLDAPLLKAAVIGGQSRIWFSSQAAFVFPSDATFTAFVERTRLLGAMPLALHRPADLMRVPPPGAAGPNDDADVRAIANLPASIPVDVELIEYAPTRLTFKVTCPQDGWLLVTDRWARSWRARIDGRETEVLGGNFLFRALAVGRGLHMVEFEFRPFLFPLPLIAGWGSLLVIAVVNIRRNRPG